MVPGFAASEAGGFGAAAAGEVLGAWAEALGASVVQGKEALRRRSSLWASQKFFEYEWSLLYISIGILQKTESESGYRDTGRPSPSVSA